MKNKSSIIEKRNTLIVIEYIIVTLFIFLSIFYIENEKKDVSCSYRASQLIPIITANGNQITTEYVDEKGRITTAADLGYAMKVVTQEDNSELIQYYDENHNPAQNSMKCFCLYREYDSKHIIRESYMDSNGGLMINLGGYSIQEYYYDKEEKLIKEKYFGTDGMPICTSSNAYGRIYEYNKSGKIYKKTYVDDKEKPMKIGLGYATTVYTYYPDDHIYKGKIETEQYFDENGEPICLSIGQYGIRKEYDENGQTSKLVYLDINMNPKLTNKGYAIVERTYYPNNTIATEKYYDLMGNPVSLSEGQYGIRHTSDGTTYLTQNGNEQFNIKNLLHNHSRMIIPFVIIGLMISAILDKRMKVFFLIIYLCVIVYLTIMYRNSTNIRNTGVLWYYKKILTDSTARADILKNIWLFIPLIAILYQLYPKKIVILIAIALSIIIETVQYAFRIGFCEIDDVISNTLGGGIGYLVGKLTIDIKLRIKSWRHIHTL